MRAASEPRVASSSSMIEIRMSFTIAVPCADRATDQTGRASCDRFAGLCKPYSSSNKIVLPAGHGDSKVKLHIFSRGFGRAAKYFGLFHEVGDRSYAHFLHH